MNSEGNDEDQSLLILAKMKTKQWMVSASHSLRVCSGGVKTN